MVPQRGQFLTRGDPALGRGVGADQQVQPLGRMRGLLEQVVKISLAVGDTDELGIRAVRLKRGGPPITGQPGQAFLHRDGPFLAPLGLRPRVAGVARPHLDIHHPQRHPLGGEGQGIVEFEPLCPFGTGVDWSQARGGRKGGISVAGGVLHHQHPRFSGDTP